MIQFAEHIFQMGWFNHQLVVDGDGPGDFMEIFFREVWNLIES